MSTRKDIIETALRAALAAPIARTFGPRGGCGRAYVCISGDRTEITAFAAAAKKCGLMFLRKAYGTSGNALYVGYDNADGKALAKADAIAAELNKHGVRAYTDAVGD